MNLSLYELRLVLVVILCIPIVYFGIRFTNSLINHALSGRKKNDYSKKRSRRNDMIDTDDTDEFR